MKKLFVTFVAIILFIFAAKAQTFKENYKIVNVGISLGNSFTVGVISIPPISASLDYGFSDKISLGIYLAYCYSKQDYSSTFGTTAMWNYSYTIFGIRGAYHFYNTDKIDAYGGLLLANDLASKKWDGPQNRPGAENVGGFTYSLFAGGRYYFDKKYAAFAELGFGAVYLTVGLAIKL